MVYTAAVDQVRGLLCSDHHPESAGLMQPPWGEEGFKGLLFQVEQSKCG